MIVWSYGGGTQSIAIAILIAQGRLPKPDRVVIADTGYEFKQTWEYTAQHVQPMRASVGLTIEIAPHSLATVGLYSLKKGEVLIPAYDATKVNTKGEHAKLPTMCSTEWKTRVVRRYIGGFEHHPTGVEMWIGMSLDELGRLKHSDVQWCRHHWPLCYDVKMTRAECAHLVESFGLPPAIKSRCKICPHQPDEEWLEVQQEPDEWKEAIALDEQIFRSHQLRLHKSCKPLNEVVFVPRSSKKENGSLFDQEECTSGYCWT